MSGNPFAPLGDELAKWVNDPMPDADWLPLASRIDRFWAFLIDTLLFVDAVPFYFYLQVLEYEKVPMGSIDVILKDLCFYFMIVFLITYLLVTGVLILGRGQTIGKLVLRLQVVNRDGSPVSGIHYLIARAPFVFGYWVPYLGPIFFLADSLMILTEERCCIHDDFAKTRVIKIG